MELDKYVGKRNSTRRHRRDDDRLQSAPGPVEHPDPGLIVTSFRNAPVFDFMNPSEKNRSDPCCDLFYDHPFKQIPRVDRCRTCHQGIDSEAIHGCATAIQDSSQSGPLPGIRVSTSFGILRLHLPAMPDSIARRASRMPALTEERRAA